MKKSNIKRKVKTILLNFHRIEKGVYIVEQLIYNLMYNKFWIYPTIRRDNGKSVNLGKWKKRFKKK